MKKVFWLLGLVTLSAYAAPLPPYLSDTEGKLVIHNRVLCKLNGKPVTVMDVIHKLEFLFYRRFPDSVNSPLARYQFFTSGWEAVLEMLIDDHLIVADAKEKGVTISEGEVREELEKLFGPDVVVNLDKVGLTLKEAEELLQRELVVQRMNMMMVHAKALTEVHPKQVRERYELRSREAPEEGVWVYRLLSLRGAGHAECAAAVAEALKEEGASLEEVVARFSSPEVELSLSTEYERKEKEISAAHREALAALTPGTYSAPLVQEAVSRIFYLSAYRAAEPLSFAAVAEQIKQELIQEAVERLGEEYRRKLRLHYGMTDSYLQAMIPRDFQPCTLVR